MMRPLRNRKYLTAVSLLFGSTVASGQCSYTVTPIPNPTGWQCTPWAINNLSQVAGTAFNGGDNTRAFRWSTNEGTVLLPLPPGIVTMESRTLNDLGYVAGTMQSQTEWYGFLWDGTTYTTIALPVWANQINVRGINNHNQVVGMIRNANFGPVHAFVWDAGVLTDLDSIVQWPATFGTAINDRGDVAGYVIQSQRSHAFVIRDSVLSWMAEPLGIRQSQIFGVNNFGSCVGEGVASQAGLGGYLVGAIWSEGNAWMIEAPELSRDLYFLGINDGGTAIGTVSRDVTFGARWCNGALVDLNSLVESPIGIVYGRAINNFGQIAVDAHDSLARLDPVWLTGDVTGDCAVQLEDLGAVLRNFGSDVPARAFGDETGDGVVDLVDLAQVLIHFGESGRP